MATSGSLSNPVVWEPPDNSPVALWNSWDIDSNGNTIYQVAAIAGANLGTGVAVVSATMASGTQGELWLCVPIASGSSYNTIACAENPGLLLTATDAGQVYVAAPLVAPANPAYQQWSVSSQGAPLGPSYSPLVNLATGNALTFGAPGAQLTVTAPSNPLASNQTWGWTPHTPIEAILNQTPEPYPVYTDDQGSTQGTAYSYIMSQLALLHPGFVDLRLEYPNLSDAISGYSAEIAAMSCPTTPPVSSDDWSVVTTELLNEIQQVDSVRLVFSNYSTVHSDAFGQQTNELNQLGKDLVMPPAAPVNGVGTALLEGTVYTLLNFIPVIGGLVGNLFETGLNAAMADGDPTTTPPTPKVSTADFQYQYSELWDKLVPDFDNVLYQLGQQEMTILQDWGMTQAVSTLTLQNGGPDSLFWPPTEFSALAQPATNGYILAALQLLWPTKFWVARCGGLPNTNPPTAFADPPAGAYWWSTGGYFTNLNIFCAVVVPVPSNPLMWQSPPFPSNSPDFPALQDFTNAGGQASVFYPPTGGWSLPVIADGFYLGGSYKPFGNWYVWTLLSTIVNMSESALSVTLIAQEGSIEGGIGGNNNPLPLGPYASMRFATDHTDGLRVVVVITGPATAGSPQVSCQLHLEVSTFFGAFIKIKIDNVSKPSGGLSIGTTTVQQMQAGDNYYTCGSVVVPVFYVPS